MDRSYPSSVHHHIYATNFIFIISFIQSFRSNVNQKNDIIFSVSAIKAIYLLCRIIFSQTVKVKLLIVGTDRLTHARRQNGAIK